MPQPPQHNGVALPQPPQHNGVAERVNLSITERIKCMLSHVKLQKSFLAEAMRTSVYLINLSPFYSKPPLNGYIPERV